MNRGGLDGGLGFHLPHCATQLRALAAASITAVLAMSLGACAERASGPTIGAPGASASASAGAPGSSTPTAGFDSTIVASGTGTPVSLWYLRRLDAQFAWAVGVLPGVPIAPSTNPARLYVTRDGGKTWKAKPTIDLSVAVTVTFVDPEHGWIAASEPADPSKPALFDTPMAHHVYRTVDGGDTWAKSAVPAPASDRLGELDVLDSQHVWVRVKPYFDGEQLPQVWSSADGGARWSRLGDGEDAQSLYFVSPLEGWGERYQQSANPNPEILHTLDGGRSWRLGVLPLPSGYFSMEGRRNHPIKTDGGLLLRGAVSDVGGDASTTPSNRAALVTWSSTDGGENWTLGPVTPVGASYAVPFGSWGTYFEFVSPDAPMVVRFFDPGDPNSPFVLDASPVCNDHVAQAQAVSARDIWVLCAANRPKSPGDERATFFVTSDGGTTWLPVFISAQPA